MGRFVKKDDQITLDRILIDGLLKNVGSKETMFLGGTKVSRDKVIAIIRQQRELSTTSKHARLQWIVAARAEQAFARKHKELRRRLVDWIRVVFGDRRMDEFGLVAPKKRRKLTTEEKKNMVEKMVATRRARRLRESA